MIKVKDASFSSGKKEVLNHASIEIKEGLVTGLYGESGCGKSTLLKIITGLLKTDSGVILKDDDILSENGKYDRKKGISVQLLFQSASESLDPEMKVERMMSEVLFYYKSLSLKERKEKIREALLKTGLKEEILSHYPYQISGGEAQRVSLARVLLLEPDYLLLDEATSSLDAINQKYILDFVKNEFVNEKRGALLVSHDLRLLREYSDVIYEMRDGEILKHED